MRALGREMQQLGFLDEAILTFEELLRRYPDEPQSYRDLAWALVDRAREEKRQPSNRSARRTDRESSKLRTSIAVKDDYARAVDLLSQMALRRWKRNYQDVELIALEELNSLLPAAEDAGVKDISLDRRLIRLLEEDFRVVLSSSNGASGGLKVTEPSGEQPDYGDRETTIGGLLLSQVNIGGGLEEYVIRKAMHGKFKLESSPVWNNQAKNPMPAMIRIDVFTNFGRSDQTHKMDVIRLNRAALRPITIGKVEF
jgi:tetratricopeptide (TPR) repeat protein